MQKQKTCFENFVYMRIKNIKKGVTKKIKDSRL